GVRVDARLAQDAAAGGTTDAEDVGERDLDALLARKVHACDTRHDQPCRCLCLGLRLQMMRTTPCRLMTLQCSQIGLTLERTFTRFSPGAVCEIARKLTGGQAQTQAGQQEGPRAAARRRSGAHSKLHRGPPRWSAPVCQEEGLAPHLLRTGHAVPPLK